MCVRFKITEEGRERLGIIIGILQIILALMGIVLIFFSIYMKIRIETKMLLLDGYNAGTVPYFLIGIGCLMLIIHLFGAKIAFDCSSSENRDRFRSILMCFFVTLCTLSVIVMAGGSVCFSHRAIIHKALDRGLYTALKDYKSQAFVKEALDRLQMEFRCCGSQKYEDWFEVSWIDTAYLDLDQEDVQSGIRDGDFFSNSVPFSCCSVTSPRPCIHDNMVRKENHIHYSNFTLYTDGCTHVLGEFFSDTVLVPAGNTVFVLFGVEMLVAILFRHLHTSIVNADEEGDPKGIGEGYCISGFLCFGEGNDPNKYLKKRDRDAERAEAEEDDWAGGGGGGGGGGGDDDDEGHSGDKQKDKKEKGKKEKGKDKEGKKDKKKDKKAKEKEKKDKKKDKKKDSAKTKKKSSPKSTKLKSPKKPKTSPKAGKGGFGGKKGGRRK